MQEHVVLLEHYDCHPFPPSVKSSAFPLFFSCFGIVGNFVIFSIFEQVLSQDGVISVGKCYKFS